MILQQEKITGLCVNCNNRETCSHLAYIKGPVICCEEYDCDTPVQQNNPVLPKHNPDKSTAAANTYSNEFQGLCINCENRFTCKSAKLAGGIWHCEEYK